MSQRGKRNREDEQKARAVAPTSRASTALLPMLSGKSTAGAVALSHEKAKSPVPGNGLFVLAGTYTSVICGMVLSATGKGGNRLAGSGATSVGAKSLAAQTSATTRTVGASAPQLNLTPAQLTGTRPLYLKFSTKHHTGSINSVAMTDKYLATAANGDEKVYLYTVKDRYSVIAELGSLNPASEVRCLAFPLAEATAQSNQNLKPMAPIGGALASLNKAAPASGASAASTAGNFMQGTSKYLLCGCDDGTLGAYNTRSWECELVLPVHGGFHLENQIKTNIANAEKLKSITKGGGKGAIESAKDRRAKVQQEIQEAKQLELLNKKDGCGIAAMAVWASPGTGNVLVLTAGATDRKLGVVDMSSGTVVTTLKLPAVHADPLTGRQKHFERTSWNPVAIVVAPPPSSKKPQDQLFAVLTAYDVWIYRMGTMTCLGRFTTRPPPPKVAAQPETTATGQRRAPPFVIPNPQYELTSLCWVSDKTVLVGTEEGKMLSFEIQQLLEVADAQEKNTAAHQAEEESSSSSESDDDEDDDEEEEEEEEDPENPFLKDPKAAEKEKARLAKKAKRQRKKEGVSNNKARKNIGHELPCVQLIQEQQVEGEDMFLRSFLVDTEVEVDPREMDDRKAAKVKTLFSEHGHTHRLRTLATVPGNKPGSSLVVSTDSHGTIAVWDPSPASDAASDKKKKLAASEPLKLKQVAVTNCEGRITASLATAR